MKPELYVPEQKATTLSFCETSPKAFRSWVNGLPMANIGEASRQLYHAIIELTHLSAPPQQRLQLLELIRPKIHFVCNELSRHYLGLAVALPEKQRKIANLSQALQLHCANGYKLCVRDLLKGGINDRQRPLLATSCHRAISELAATILRAHQLYCPSPARSWLECHHLYRYAVLNGLADLPVEDDTLVHRRSSSVNDCYKRILLLGCARPNQLRQNELNQAYDLFEQWTDHVACSHDLRTSALFVVDMDCDAPPAYRSLLDEPPGADYYGFDTHELSERIGRYLQTLSDHRQAQRDSGLSLPASVNNTLLSHLSQALGILTERNHNRITTRGSLQICVGLSAAHYFIAGQKSFNDFVSGNDNHGPRFDDNVFLQPAGQPQQDVWAEAHDAGPVRTASHDTDAPIQFRGSKGTAAAASSARTETAAPVAHEATLVNASPGGYCVSWDNSIPTSLQAGEILGIREQANHPWSVAVVRWIRHVRNQGTQVGIELLAPSASPCGVRLIQKVGTNSAYLRGLLLPEIRSEDQPATLITPRLPFQAGSRISLLHDGFEDQGMLSRQVSATGSISQFELKLQNRELTGIAKPATPAIPSRAPAKTSSTRYGLRSDHLHQTPGRPMAA